MTFKEELYQISKKSTESLKLKFYSNLLALAKADITYQFTQQAKKGQKKFVYLFPASKNLLNDILTKEFKYESKKDVLKKGQVKLLNSQRLALFSLKLFEPELLTDISAWLEEQKLNSEILPTGKSLPVGKIAVPIEINSVPTMLKPFKVPIYKIEAIKWVLL